LNKFSVPLRDAEGESCCVRYHRSLSVLAPFLCAAGKKAKKLYIEEEEDKKAWLGLGGEGETRTKYEQ